MKQCGKEPIILSVCIVTYNHEKYIKQCIDSILQQKVEFSIEILIGNDCSTDKTACILGEEYGSKVVLINREKNIGLCANMYDLFLRAKGKYVYLFSGDDFLHINYVFSKQVEFLEKNPEYFSVSARNLIYKQKTDSYQDIMGPVGEYSIYNYLLDGGVPSVVGTMRNVFAQDKEFNGFLKRGARNNEEMKLWLYTLDKGKKYIIDEPMSVYRSVTEYEDNYNSTHTIVDKVHDYAMDYRIVNRIYGNKYNVKPYYLRLLNWYCVHMSYNIKDMVVFFKSLSLEDTIALVMYKMYLKTHGYKNPLKWTKEDYLIKNNKNWNANL